MTVALLLALFLLAAGIDRNGGKLPVAVHARVVAVCTPLTPDRCESILAALVDDLSHMHGQVGSTDVAEALRIRSMIDATCQAAMRRSGRVHEPRRGGGGGVQQKPKLMEVLACRETHYQIKSWILREELGYTTVNQEVQRKNGSTTPLGPWDLMFGGMCVNNWLHSSRLD